MYVTPIRFLQVNVTRYFYLLVSNGNLTLHFHTQVVHTVRINIQETSLAARPEK